METESIGSSVSSLSSEFSFADTVSYSAPLDISGLDGGSYNPGLNLTDLIPYTADFCQPNVQLVEDCHAIARNDNYGILDYKIPEAFKIGLAESNLDPDVEDSEVPQVYYDAFKEEDSLTPPSYLETINKVDLVDIKSQTEIIEQINFSSEPEIAQKVVGQVKSQNSKVKIAIQKSKLEEKNEEESASAKASADEEEKKGKQLKFVVDEKALAKRRDALQTAIEQTPTEIKDGVEVIDSNKVVALMPTGKEKPTINSDLLDIGLDSDGIIP